MFASDDEDDDTATAAATSSDRHNRERSTSTTRTGSGRSRSSQNSRGKNVAFAGDVDGGHDDEDDVDNGGSRVTADSSALSGAVGQGGSFDLSTYATEGHKVCVIHFIMTAWFLYEKLCCLDIFLVRR